MSRETQIAGDNMNLTGQVGRPSNQPQQRLQECELYQLLLKKLPAEYIREGDSRDYLNVKKMSRVCGYSQFTILRWIRGVHFTKNSISALLQINDTSDQKGSLTKEDLIPFLINI